METTENGVQVNEPKEEIKKGGNIEKLMKGSNETETVETDEFNKIDLGKINKMYEPFMIVGKAFNYTLVLGNTAVWDEPLRDEEEAMELLAARPWKLMLIASKVYSEYVNEYIKNVNKK